RRPARECVIAGAAETATATDALGDDAIGPRPADAHIALRGDGDVGSVTDAGQAAPDAGIAEDIQGHALVEGDVAADAAAATDALGDNAMRAGARGPQLALHPC